MNIERVLSVSNFSDEIHRQRVLYLYMLSERVPVEKPEARGKKPQLLYESSAIVLLYLLHDSALKISGKEEKDKLADLVESGFRKGKHRQEATLFHYDASSIAIAEECGGKFIKQLRGNPDSETNILVGQLPCQSVVPLINIIHDCVLKLPLGTRKEYANFIDQFLDIGNNVLFQFSDESGVDKMNYPQIEAWGKRFIRDLTKP